MIIKNGQIFDAAGSFFPGILTIKDSIITGVIKEKGVSGDENNIENKISNIENDMIPTDPKNNDEQIVDASDMYVIPGLTDIHFHGCVGHDFCEGKVEAIEAMAEYQLSQGITTICPASMSFDEEKLTGVFNSARDYHSKKGASLVGINMEGPFISYEKRGAQNPEYIFKPDADMFKRLQKASGGLIKLLDIAPEVDGARECIEELVNQVHISIAHTRADYDIAMETFRMGADHVTHLYNGMSNFHHRNPGVIGAASDWDKAYVELIGDGVHSTGSTVRATLKMIGDDRLVLISDSMEACGMPDGEYELVLPILILSCPTMLIESTELTVILNVPCISYMFYSSYYI